ncbi:transcriptional regulator, TetR family [Rhodococcus aetherivorans]|uniref:Transcriptional regulator, TetR family n=2 Tax=Rhodococcus aetherivorans TaxID=191292 RepID=A0ABQ0YTK5_9NOCA|nr:transcriptional regulator, TetR family [Rhodococcus rhodochrous ATCC 21198]NGP29799.1 TetR/AcrR family transcriptional regulator [Rhodococcus aetherivorans]GES39952.1 transcriptional regulator, TetR family [Rhodococcus aetherivorans]
MDMKEGPPRPYRMVARARSAAQTTERIMDATLELYRDYWLDEITLERVAERAGVSIKTVQRKFGNRDGLLSATLQWIGRQVTAQRFPVAAGDVDAAVENLMTHYEQWGPLGLRHVLQAQRSPFIASIVARAQGLHHRWVEQAFAPYLDSLPPADREMLFAQLAASTDVLVWHVFRNDLGLSAERTGQALSGILRALLPATPPART